MRSKSLDELHQLNNKQRMIHLLSMSTSILDNLTPTELENITFHWFRAYHATLYNCDFREINQINQIEPQWQRITLHSIILAQDDRSFDRLDECTIQTLMVIFMERKSKAGLSAFDPGVPSSNEFSVKPFAHTGGSWAAQADELDTVLDQFHLAGDDDNPQRQPGHETSDTGLESGLAKMHLGDHGPD